MRNHHCDEDKAWSGSIGPASIEIHEIPGVLKSKTCLLPMVTDFSVELNQLYKHYKNQILPLSGGLFDQPKAYSQAMSILETAWQTQQK